MAEWRRALLKRMGMPVTQKNLTFLATWQRWEGGHTNNTATYNWLNTTQGKGTPINGVGVLAFDSFDYGIKQTAATLHNGYYDDILDALASGDPYKVKPSRGLQTWVSGPNGSNPGYAAKILGTPVDVTPVAGAPHKPVRSKPQRAARGRKPLSTSTISMIFGDDPFWHDYFARSAEADPVPGNDLVKVPGNDPSPDGAPGKGVHEVVKFASTQLGKPYVFGSGPDTSSFDCSDLIQWAYKQIGVDISRTTFTQIKEGRDVKGQKLQPGDLFFSSPGHVMMYVGKGKLISAPRTGEVVQYKNVSDYGTPYAVRRIL
jgi:cell wall-associated NlpC family hydrolase